MNNKGFTLMEMLATVVIVGILLSITTISIVGYINDSREKARQVEESNIITAAQTCLKEKKCNAEWKTISEEDNECVIVSTDNLKTYGYLKYDQEFKDEDDITIQVYFKRDKNTKVIKVKKIIDNGDTC